MHSAPSDERPYGIAILAATACMAITMSLHPSGSQLLNAYADTVVKNVVAHGIALIGVPLSLMGAIGIGRRLRHAGSRATANLALVTYLVSNVAVLIAGSASGLMAPAIARRLAIQDPSTVAIWRALFSYNGIINQAFATIYVVGLALSVLLWSLAILRSTAYPRWIGSFGVVLSLALLGVLTASRAHLDVHTFGLVALLQGAWMVAVALPMLRPSPSRA